MTYGISIRTSAAVTGMRLREKNRIYPWANKKDKAIWRGAAIGNAHGGHNWRDIPGA
jgi:hypothetical protein